MTLNEAKERAVKVWGFEPNQIQLRPDGGADLDYGYSEVQPYGHHRLDANGHVTCHHDCQEKEKKINDEIEAALAAVAEGWLLVVSTLGDAIRDLGTVPSGHLYARVMGHLTLEQYNKAIDTLKRTGLVAEKSHELHWIGKDRRP